MKTPRCNSGLTNQSFRVFEGCSVVRKVFEIMISREYVDEFASVQEEVGRPAQTFRGKVNWSISVLLKQF